MKKYIKIPFLFLRFLLFLILVIGVTAAITKNIYADILINNFKKQAVYQPDLSTETVKIYHVDVDLERESCTMHDDILTPGNATDIIISLDLKIDSDVLGAIVSFFAGGHAGIVLDDYVDSKGSASTNFTLESTGFGEDTDAFVFNKNFWYLDEACPYDEIIGLRVDTTEHERHQIVAKAMALVGEPYNYTFFFNTKNTSYCTDIIGKAFKEAGVNLNKDGLTTSVYDLLISNKTYISYYCKIDSDGIKHIYYLV